MKLIVNSNMPFSYIIQKDKSAGFYFYVYIGNFCVKDYLQDTFESAAEQAVREFGVSRDSWRKKGNCQRWDAKTPKQAVDFIVQPERGESVVFEIKQKEKTLYRRSFENAFIAKNFAFEKFGVTPNLWRLLS